MGNRKTVALIVGIATLLVGGLTVEAVPSSSADDQPVGATSEATPTSQAGDVGTPGPTPSDPAPGAAATTSTLQGAVQAPSTQSPQEGGEAAEETAVHAPRDGEYPRRITWEMQKPFIKRGSNQIVVRIATTGRTAEEVRQHVSTTTVSSENEQDGRPAIGLGPYDLRHVRDAVFINDRPSGNHSSSCEPADRLHLQLPLREGLAWTTTQECTYDNGSTTRKSQREWSSRVNGGRTVSAPGGDRFVWEITTTNSSTTTTRLYSPELGVDVRIDIAVDSSYMAYKSTSELTGLPG